MASLLVAHAVALVLVLALSDASLREAVLRGDTASYLPPAHRRPPLYPWLLSTLGLRGTIALQVLASGAMVVGAAALLRRTLPHASRAAGAVALCFCGLATLGLALSALSDLLAAASFALATLALVLGGWRTALWLMPLGLAASVLLRPVYVLAPLCVPAALALRSALGSPPSPGRRWALLGIAVATTAAASAASLTYRPAQRALVAHNLAVFEAYALTGAPPGPAAASTTGASFAQACLQHPVQVLSFLGTSAGRVLLAPVEGVAVAAGLRARPLWIALSLPLLLLGYWPPRDRLAFAAHRLALVVLVCLVLPGALAPFQGERLRAAALPWLVIPLAANLARWAHRAP